MPAETAARIGRISAWEALDSRGTPTVACEVLLTSGAAGTATVPVGASTGRHEARELRDGGARYGGLGVRRAVAGVREEIAARLRGHDIADQEGLDQALRELDGTADLRRLGANAVLAVSVAAALAAAVHHGVPLYRWLGDDGPPLLPMPMVNVLSGGAHAGGAVDLQDFLVVPVGAASFAEAIEWCWRVRRAAQELVAQQWPLAGLVADEGGLAARLTTNVAALELLVAAFDRAGLAAGSQVAAAIDVAATQLVTAGGSYRLGLEERELTAHDLAEELAAWRGRYPVVSIEDGLGEDDWGGWAELTARLGDRTQLLGDDLFVTDGGRLDRGIAAGVANAVLVKPNQTGTLSAARDVVHRARAAGYATVVSARSGETEDAWLADLAVGWRAGQIKVGSVTRSERTAKWNRLLRIEAEEPASTFAGPSVLAAWTP